jgi:biofilm PGA synthesis protein PgaA
MDPRNAEAAAESAAILAGLRGPYGAGAIVAPSASLHADQAATMVVWGEAVHPPDPAHGFDGTDAAIARLDALIAAQREAATPDSALIRRMRLDRVVAYRDRVRMADAAAEAASLRSGGELPVYAREALADALLYLHRPEEAGAEYDAVLAAAPQDENARYGRFYAAVEMEDFTRAYAVADALLADSPVWRYAADGPARYANPSYTYAALRAAQVRLWGDEVADGWGRLSPLVHGAPANQALRLGMTGAMTARGWPRAADMEAHIAASLGPDDLGAQLALAEAALSRRRLPEAEARSAALVQLYPENLSVQRLARDLDAEHRFLLEVDVAPAVTQGGGIWAAGRELDSSFTLTSPPIHGIWRAFVLGSYGYANPPEGFVSRIMAGGGVALRLPDWTARAYATGNGGTLSRAGGGASVDWTPSDQVSLGVEGQIFAAQTPLRALLYGITANEANVNASYRWDETRAVKVTASLLPFSDGNQRTTAGAGLSQLLYSQPHLDLTGRVDLYASHNTRDGAPYYNPAADFSATAGLTLQHVLWRRYDESLTQALALDAGSYTERGYGTGWMGVASYEQRWRFNPLTELYYGVSYSRRLYDGVPETAGALQFGIRQRI